MTRSQLPPIIHILRDGSRLTDDEFKAWCRAHTIPRDHPVYAVIEGAMSEAQEVKGA